VINFVPHEGAARKIGLVDKIMPERFVTSPILTSPETTIEKRMGGLDILAVMTSPAHGVRHGRDYAMQLNRDAQVTLLTA
jgi:hypothetical protein